MSEHPSPDLLEEWARRVSAAAESVGSQMAGLWAALGITLPAEQGYEGRRHGWHPHKPRRTRKVKR